MREWRPSLNSKNMIDIVFRKEDGSFVFVEVKLSADAGTVVQIRKYEELVRASFSSLRFKSRLVDITIPSEVFLECTRYGIVVKQVTRESLIVAEESSKPAILPRGIGFMDRKVEYETKLVKKLERMMIEKFGYVERHLQLRGYAYRIEAANGEMRRILRAYIRSGRVHYETLSIKKVH